MSNTKNHNSLRSKTLKIACSEERALEIVKPIFNLTAYILNLKKNLEIPSFESMQSSIMSSKTSLAKLLAVVLMKPIEPKGLRINDVQALLSGGYFKVGVRYHTGLKDNRGIETIENYSVVLHNEQNVLLMDCFVSLKEIELGRNLTGEERLEAISRSLEL